MYNILKKTTGTSEAWLIHDCYKQFASEKQRFKQKQGLTVDSDFFNGQRRWILDFCQRYVKRVPLSACVAVETVVLKKRIALLGPKQAQQKAQFDVFSRHPAVSVQALARD